MSYLLEFPPRGPLPSKARSPPYVLFGINGDDCFHHFPPEVPLDVVLHYVPKLKQWILPIPSLSPKAQKMALTKPYIGIDILGPFRAEAVSEIVVRMLQHAGVLLPRKNFYIHPTIRFSIAIQEAWLAFELPIAGLANLHTHMQALLTHGPPIQDSEMRTLWGMFPITSPIIYEMGMNYVRSLLEKQYTQSQVSTIRLWHAGDREPKTFFEKLESQFPQLDTARSEIFAE
ncbi:hypothetical protein P280DRAFT_375063, partial [Massarina eburnea CBS 473.64]